MSRRSSLQASQPTPSSTPLTTRVIRHGVVLLENLDQQRYAKRGCYSTVLADEPDGLDSNSPIYDSFLASQGAEVGESVQELSGCLVRHGRHVTASECIDRRVCRKKLYYSDKHSLYGHKVEVSMVPNGFAIDCTKFYKGSVSDKTIFDKNIDSHLYSLAKPPLTKCIQHNVRAVLPLKKPVGGILTFAEQTKDDRIASDRVMFENYLVG
ncbi:hypothetical protein AaE_010902 [Aphanomyces astaci]|uniref:DDE Tnp4 domain-containing protein n=1 Tax=Aphanomyces astaci TaxID=112090 RepID=A0A6A4ZUA7_APHAT|nr:hypothetical protein AaE_010902 [Aphanomyces astaci]